MALETKPTIKNVWAKSGLKVEPSDAKADTGWIVERPPHQFQNFLQNRSDQFLKHLNEAGIAVWDALTSYTAGKSYVQGSDGAIYKALTDSTGQNPVGNIVNWVKTFGDFDVQEYADAAEASANDAAGSADAAAASQTSASGSASSATAFAAAALASQTAAAASASAASGSASAASSSASAASTSATNALASENKAMQWAIKTDGPVDAGEYSAKYWAQSVAGGPVVSWSGLTGVITYAQARTALNITNVDNTADVAKPVSTAQQTALNLKLDIASPTVAAATSLTVAAGTTTVPPIKFQSGVVTTTPVNHAKEWDGTDEWQTSSAGVRRQMAQYITASTLIPGLQYGQCKLSLSGTNLILNRLDGSYLFINGYFRQIPSAGVTLAATGAAVNFTYYIYASWSGSAIVLSFSSTSPVIDSTYGHMVKTGDITMTLVGMARTITGPSWVDSQGQRFILSWFNQKPKPINFVLTSNINVGATSYTSVSGSFLVEFLHWANTSVRLNIQGSGSIPTTGFGSFGFEFDFSGTPTDPASIIQQAGSNTFNYPFNLAYEDQNLTEGYHAVSLVAKVTTAGPLIFNGAPSAANSAGRCTITGSVMG